MSPVTVGLLFGGPSPEHQVSIQSAQGVDAALAHTPFTCVPIYVTREGVWLCEERCVRQVLEQGESTDVPQAGGGIFLQPGVTGTLFSSTSEGSLGLEFELDLFFPLIHGPYGEDGTLQGILNTLDVPYVGSGVLGSALCMDKACAKTVLAAQGIPQVDYDVVQTGGASHDLQSAAKQIDADRGYPCFVKPARGGSSIGISRVDAQDQLMPALREAAQYDSKLVIEEAVEAREIECGVLGNGELEASRPGEILPAHPFYDYESKYVIDSTLIIPVELPPDQEKTVRELALLSYAALHCRGYARVDFLIDKSTDAIYVNEINTAPGFTPISMFPKLWEVSGVSIPELLERMIELALEDHQERRSLSSAVSQTMP